VGGYSSPISASAKSSVTERHCAIPRLTPTIVVCGPRGSLSSEEKFFH
jgi:hypothetical protein